MFSGPQFGFMQGHSYMLQLLAVLEECTEIVDMGGCVDVIYLDFIKHFTLFLTSV
jgi:hemerythrin-like domain-containing protein